MVTGIDILAARHRLAAHLSPTPVVESASLSTRLDRPVWLKLESTNATQSFKIRGALHALLRLRQHHPDPATRPLLVTASAGNHGRAMAQAARWLDLAVHVFVPATAPQAKTSAIRRLGAALHTSPTYDEAERQARLFAAERGGVFVSPYNHPDVITGAGTIGLELVEHCANVGTVVIPIGGGGLASGVGTALRAAAPRARVVAVEVEASTPFTSSLARGQVTAVTVGPTLADGLAGNLEDGTITFPLVQQVVDDVITVGEDEVMAAMRALAVEERLMVEGSAAVGVAALMGGQVRLPPGPVVAIISGANIDFEVWRRVVGV